MKFNIYIGCLALFCVSGVANAGLFERFTENAKLDAGIAAGIAAGWWFKSSKRWRFPGLGGLSIPSGAASGAQASGAGMGNCGGPDKKKIRMRMSFYFYGRRASK